MKAENKMGRGERDVFCGRSACRGQSALCYSNIKSVLPNECNLKEQFTLK